MNSPGVRKQRVRTSVVALFVGAIPVLIGLLVVALPQYRDLIINTILIYSIAFNVVLFCFYIILSSKRSEVREKESRKYSKILSSIGSIFRARTGLSNTLFDILNGSADSEDYKYMSREFLYYSLNLMKEIAEVYTNDVCSVSIKIIYVDLNEDLEPGVPIVSTYLRDSTSTISRRQTDKTLERYKLSEHKPFSVLTTAGSNGFYFSNNLAKDEKKGKYYNANSDYKKYYNATAVSPISNPGTLYNEDIIGFLCIDNASGGFDDDAFRAIMEIVASTIFYVMRNTVMLEIALDTPDASATERKATNGE